jgi:hypothetical protein
MHSYRFILTTIAYFFIILIHQVYSKTLNSLFEQPKKRYLQTLNENPCFKLLQRNNSFYLLKSYNSSWSKNAYSELTFTLHNTCNFEIGIKNDLIIVIDQWKINGNLIRNFMQSQESTPYLEIYATIQIGKIHLELSSFCKTGLCDRSKFAKNGTKDITLTVSSYANIYSSLINSIYIEGNNLMKVPGNLLINFDTTKLLSYFSNNSVITTYIYFNSTKKLVKSIIFDPINSKGNYSESISGLEPGSYYIEINRASLPNPSGIYIGINYNMSNNFTIESNQTTKVSITFNTTILPVSSLGNITIQLTKFPSEFLGKVMVNATISNKSQNYNNSILFSSSSTTVLVKNLLVNSTYEVNLPGLAYPSLDKFISPLQLITPRIVNGSELNMNITYGNASTNGLFNVSVNVSGYNGSQAVPISFISNQQKYVYVDDFLAINSSQIWKFPLNEQIKMIPNVPQGWKVKVIPDIISSATSQVNFFFTRENPYIAGYYESRFSKWASSGKDHSLSQIPSYISRVLLAFASPNNNYVAGSESFRETGLLFISEFHVIKSAIAIGKESNPNQKFILSVGGPNYQWIDINYQGLIDLMNDLGLDGIDLHYLEIPSCTGVDSNNLTCSSDQSLIQIIDKLKALLPNDKILTAAVISVGAYGTTNFPISKYGPQSIYSGMWVNPLKNSKNKLDEIFIISYDSSLTYSPTDGFDAYKSLFDKRIYLGLEVPNESWGGYVLNVSDAMKFSNHSRNNNGNGVFIWSLEKSNENVNANDFIRPICILYGYSNCAQLIPSN